MKKEVIHQKRTNIIWAQDDLIDSFREFLRTEFESSYGDFGQKTYQDLFDEVEPIWTLYGGIRIGDDTVNISQGKYEAYIKSKLNAIASNKEAKKSQRKGKRNILRFLAWLSECQPELETKWFELVVGSLGEDERNLSNLFILEETTSEPNSVSGDVSSSPKVLLEHSTSTAAKDGNDSSMLAKVFNIIYPYWVAITSGAVLVFGIPFAIQFVNGMKEETPTEDPEISSPGQAPNENVWDQIPEELWINGNVTDFRAYARKADITKIVTAGKNGDAKALALGAIGHHFGIFSQWDHGLEIREFGIEACSGSMGIACLLVGDHYTSGRGIVERNRSTAMKYYRQGCDHNFGIACDRFALRSVIDTNDNGSISAGFAAITKACENGRASSCSNLAFLYLRDDVWLPSNIGSARQYYQEACSLGMQNSCKKMNFSDDELRVSGLGFWRPSAEALEQINQKHSFNNSFYTYGRVLPPEIPDYSTKPIGEFNLGANTTAEFNKYSLIISTRDIGVKGSSISLKTEDMLDYVVVYRDHYLRVKNSKGEYYIINPSTALIYQSGAVTIGFRVYKP